MKKKLLFLLLMIMPMSMLAQTVVTDSDTGLKYLTDDTDLENKNAWYIYVASDNNDIGGIQIDGVDANKYFVTHPTFRPYVRSQCDANTTGKIYWSTLQEKTSFSANYSYTNSGNNANVNYQGIEYFPNLTSFTDANSSSATSIVGDFSKNKKLGSLTWSNSTGKNKITSLDISNNEEMTSWTVPTGSTAGFTLMAKNTALTSLNIASSNVSILDVSGSANLTTVTTKTANSSYLREVNIVGTNITSLDLTKYTGLKKVTFDYGKMTWGTSGADLLVPSGFIAIRRGNVTDLLKNENPLTIDVTNEDEKDIDLSGCSGLTWLKVIGATGVTLPNLSGSSFSLEGTGSPDLVVNLGSQTSLKTLALTNVNEVDISGCSALNTLYCYDKGVEWGDGTEGHKGIIFNTGAAPGSETLPNLTTIYAMNSGVQKLDLTNAAMNLNTINLLNSTTKELRIPNHTKITSYKYEPASSAGLFLGYSSVDTKNYYGKFTYKNEESASWHSEGTFYYNQLEVLDISGTGLGIAIWLSADESLNYNESPLREFYAKGCNITRFVNYNSPLHIIDVRDCSKMKHFWVEQTQIETVDLSGCTSIESFNAKRNRLTDLDFLTMPCTGRAPEDIAKLKNIQVNGGASASRMKDENGNEKVIVRDVFTNKISNVNTTYLGSALKTLQVADNLLQTLDIHSGLTGLTSFQCENNMLLTLDLSNLPVSGQALGSKWGWNMAGGVMQVGFLNVEAIKGEAEDGSQDWIAMLLPNGGGFDHLLDNTVGLYPSIQDANAGTNEIAEEANPFMGTIEHFSERMGYNAVCPDGHTGEHLFLHSQYEIKGDNGGKVKDQDLYGKVLTYKYDTKFNGGAPATVTDKDGNSAVLDNHIQIRAHIWPYILNINPATKDATGNPTGTNYYSSTIYLDYDALIPDGVKVYVVTGLKEGYKEIGQPESPYDAQLICEEVGVPGEVLPKRTPVIVKSETAAGLYSFKTVWDFDFKGWEDFSRQQAIAQAYAEKEGIDVSTLSPVLHGVDEENIIYRPEYDPATYPEKWVNKKNGGEMQTYLEDNILSGTLVDKPVGVMSVLTLGRQKAPDGNGNVSLKLGFWRYNGTVVAAHRCFITGKDLDDALKAGNFNNSKEGGAFYFGDGEVTGIRTVVTEPEKTEQVVYDLQGRRVIGKPAPGIYIVNGKKVVVKQ